MAIATKAACHPHARKPNGKPDDKPTRKPQWVQAVEREAQRKAALHHHADTQPA